MKPTLCSLTPSRLLPLALRVIDPEEGEVSMAPSGFETTLALVPPEKDKALKKPKPGGHKPDQGKKEKEKKLLARQNKTKPIRPSKC